MYYAEAILPSTVSHGELDSYVVPDSPKEQINPTLGSDPHTAHSVGHSDQGQRHANVASQPHPAQIAFAPTKSVREHAVLTESQRNPHNMQPPEPRLADFTDYHRDDEALCVLLPASDNCMTASPVRDNAELQLPLPHEQHSKEPFDFDVTVDALQTSKQCTNNMLLRNCQR